MMLRTFDLEPSHHSSIIHPSIRARFVRCTLTKLAWGLGPAKEIALRTFNVKPSHHSCIIHRFQAISSFFHHPSIDQSQNCMVQPLKLASGLGAVNEMMLRTFDLKLSYHSSIDQSQICMVHLHKIALGLGNEMTFFFFFFFFFLFFFFFFFVC